MFSHTTPVPLPDSLVTVGENLQCPEVGIPVHIWQGSLGYDLEIAPGSLIVLLVHYLTIISQTRVGYEMIDIQRDA